jgi:glutamyl-tRNA reductase
MKTVPGLKSQNKFVFFLAVLQLHLIMVWGFVVSDSGVSTASGQGKCPFLATRDYFARQMIAVGQCFTDAPTVFKPPKIDGRSLCSRRSNIRARLKRRISLRGGSRADSALYAGSDEDGGGGTVAHSQCEPADPNLEVVVLGISHHTAPVEVRERLAVPEELWNEASQTLCQYKSISEAAVLSTCNRFEIYLSGKNKFECVRDGIHYLEQRAGPEMDLKSLRSSIFILSGDDAIWHLFRVAAGLDSIVLGEGQILAQVKKAYEHGVSPSGSAGKVVSRMLNTALAAGKRVRTETQISKGSVSISSAAAAFTTGILKGELNEMVQPTAGSASEPRTRPSEHVYPALDQARIAILGAGKMARLLLVHLESQGIKNVTIVNRTPERIRELQQEFPEMAIELRGMEEVYDVVRESDIIYPSTSSPGYIVEPAELSKCLKERSRPYTVQFVDISVPRNVHPDCAMVPGVALFNVDHLKLVVDRNSALRQLEIVNAEGILRQEMEKYKQWQQSLNAIPTIAKLYEKAEVVRSEELQKLSKKLLNLSERDMEVVDRLSKLIVAKLIHGPVNHLRQQKEIESVKTAIQQLQQAFQLEASS